MVSRLKIILLSLFCAGVLCSTAQAQSTLTEKEAAEGLINKITQFDKEYHPMSVAKKMVRRNDKKRDAAVKQAAQYWDNHMQSLGDWITTHPELGFKEHRAVDTLTSVMKAIGFSVKVGVAGLPTAFVGRFDSPAGINGPHLGIVIEYDALPARGGGAYHGDQHSTQGPIGISAAYALSKFMAKNSIPGQIYIYGTPAEETGPPAKRIMLEHEVFKDADVVLRSHSSGGKVSLTKSGFGSCCLDINMRYYFFKGRSTHQLSSYTGRNALEAAVQFYTSVDRLSSSWRPEANVKGVILAGGKAPNVIPDSTVLEYYIRYPDGVYLEHVTNMVDRAAKAAATATGTKVYIKKMGRYRDGFSYATLNDLVYQYAKKYVPSNMVSSRKSRPIGWDETGVVSRKVPGAGIQVPTSHAPNHTLQMYKDALTPYGHNGFKLDVKIMTAVGYDLLTNSDYLQLIKREQEMLRSGFNGYINNLKKEYDDEINVKLDDIDVSFDLRKRKIQGKYNNQ